MVLTAPASGPVIAPTPEITIDDLAAFIGATATIEMQQYVTAALTYVRDTCGPLTGAQWRFLRPQPGGGRRLSLPRWPTVRMATLDALTDPDGTAVLSLLTASTDVDWRTGAILAPYRRDGLWTITATLTRPADVTTTLKLAGIVVAKSLLELQRAKSARPGAYGPQDATPAPSWTGIPARAQALMKPYLQRPVG